MKVTLERKNSEFLFEAKGASGIPVMIDNKTVDEVKGSSSMKGMERPQKMQAA